VQQYDAFVFFHAQPLLYELIYGLEIVIVMETDIDLGLVDLHALGVDTVSILNHKGYFGVVEYFYLLELLQGVPELMDLLLGIAIVIEVNAIPIKVYGKHKTSRDE